MIFTMPLKIVSEANLMEHWSNRHKRHIIQKNVITMTMIRHVDKIQLPCTIKMTRIAPRSLDSDNLAMALKNIRDVVADLLIPGKAKGRADGDPRLEFVCLQEKGKPKEYALKIEIVEK